MKNLLAVLILGVTVVVRADDAVPAAPAAAENAAAPSVKVDKLTLTTGIKERQPVDESAKFSAGFPVYCWTKFSVSNPPASVKYVWTADGKPAGDYAVELKTGTARWWSKKTVRPGAWKVEIVDDKGASLGSAVFTVTAADAGAPASASPASAAPVSGDAPAAAAPKSGGE